MDTRLTLLHSCTLIPQARIAVRHVAEPDCVHRQPWRRVYCRWCWERIFDQWGDGRWFHYTEGYPRYCSKLVTPALRLPR